jgi:tetratricopeptide (TPR) repeat protein
VARTDLTARQRAKALYFLGYAYTNHFPKGANPYRRALDHAIETWSVAIAADPGFIDAYLAKGYYLVNGIDSPDAVTVYDQAIRLAPFDWRGYAGKAQALQAMGRKTAALFESEIAVGLAPESKQAAEVLGDMLALNGRNSEAAVAYTQALRPFNPIGTERLGLLQEPNIWSTTAGMFNRIGEPAKAIAILNQYLDTLPKQQWEFQDIVDRASYEEAIGDYKAAAADLELAMLRPEAFGIDGLAARRDVALIKAGEANSGGHDVWKEFEHGSLHQILLVQVFLKNSGYKEIEINGKFDEPTREALRLCLAETNCAGHVGQPI